MATDRHERIRQRAYELWEHEGRPEGRALDHWRRAEAETAAAQPGAGGDEHQSDPGAAPPAPALGSSDGFAPCPRAPRPAAMRRPPS